MPPAETIPSPFSGPQPTWESRETNRLMRWPEEQLREERREPSRLTFWRQASPTSPEKLPKQDRGPQPSGSATTLAEDDDTAPQGWKDKEGPGQDQEGASQPVLSASFRTRGSGRPFGEAGQAPGDRCWFCGTRERQTCFHLFAKCRRWEPGIRRLWQRIKLDCGYGGAPSV